MKEDPSAIYQRAMFYEKYGITPEGVDKARRVIKQNNDTIQMHMDFGSLTDERLTEIREDKEQQDRYAEIMGSFENGGKKDQETRSQLLSMPADELCGWFEYFQKHYEEKFHIEFISPEEKARCHQIVV